MRKMEILAGTGCENSSIKIKKNKNHVIANEQISGIPISDSLIN